MKWDEIKSLLNSIDDPVIKLETLMDIGKSLPPIPDGQIGTEITGCASKVEIYNAPDNKLYGKADSALVRGILAVLLAIKESCVDFDEFHKLGINLGSGRLMGTASMIEYLKSL